MKDDHLKNWQRIQKQSEQYQQELKAGPKPSLLDEAKVFFGILGVILAICAMIFVVAFIPSGASLSAPVSWGDLLLLMLCFGVAFSIWGRR